MARPNQLKMEYCSAILNLYFNLKRFVDFIAKIDIIRVSAIFCASFAEMLCVVKV